MATTDAFELHSKEIRYQPRSGKQNHKTMEKGAKVKPYSKTNMTKNRDIPE